MWLTPTLVELIYVVQPSKNCLYKYSELMDGGCCYNESLGERINFLLIKKYGWRRLLQKDWEGMHLIERWERKPTWVNSRWSFSVNFQRLKSRRGIFGSLVGSKQFLMGEEQNSYILILLGLTHLTSIRLNLILTNI